MVIFIDEILMHFTHISNKSWRSECIHLLFILFSNFIDSSTSLSVHQKNVVAFIITSQFGCLLIWCECDLIWFNELQECWYMVLWCLLSLHKWWCKHLKLINIPRLLPSILLTKETLSDRHQSPKVVSVFAMLCIYPYKQFSSGPS